MADLDTRTASARRHAHEARVDPLIAPALERRASRQTHPVDDFLFTYYSYRPRALRRWHPGIGVTVCGPEAANFSGRRGYRVEAGRARVDDRWIVGQFGRIEWIRSLLVATSRRSPMLGCFGLHEWAMVYRQPESQLRHSAYPLRLGQEGTDDVVEAHRIACTHFDAFRFFTDPARPLNIVQPTRETQIHHDQPGCLHAAMDCYKWAYKLAPLTPSELVADCFELALAVRRVDMQAAPYDLSSLGVEPIRIETVEGKQQYVEAQRSFAARAGVLRERLLGTCDRALRAGSAGDTRATQAVGDRIDQRVP
jgi:hypothetical protein